MMRDHTNHRAVVVATLAAGLLVLVFGLTYRVLAFQLGAPVRSLIPIDSSALERFPLEIGDWTGQDVPLDEAIARKTGTDVYINRRYSRHNGRESVCLYLASGTMARTVVGHRPEICYVAAGWTLDKRRFLEVSLSEETKVPCSLFEFSRSGLNTTKTTVLNYFIVDGQFYGDVATLQSKAGRRLGMVDYAAQVQISLAERLSADLATRIISDFAADSGPLVVRLFEDIEEQRRSTESRKDPQEK